MGTPFAWDASLRAPLPLAVCPAHDRCPPAATVSAFVLSGSFGRAVAWFPGAVGKSPWLHGGSLSLGLTSRPHNRAA